MEEEEDDIDFDSKKDAVIKLKNFFVRKANIYLEDISGNLKCLNAGNCKL